MNTPPYQALLQTLQQRFESHHNRHSELDWQSVLARVESQPAKLAALQAMEDTGGEPDVIDHDPATGDIIFCDCAKESPTARRSLCYDGEALAARKENKPKGSALDMAATMGIELLTEAQYRALQALGEFDCKTSSWLQTPPAIRKLDGAIFGDRRYNTVFIYHNGAQSYYAARGFRGLLRV